MPAIDFANPISGPHPFGDLARLTALWNLEPGAIRSLIPEYSTRPAWPWEWAWARTSPGVIVDALLVQDLPLHRAVTVLEDHAQGGLGKATFLHGGVLYGFDRSPGTPCRVRAHLRTSHLTLGDEPAFGGELTLSWARPHPHPPGWASLVLDFDFDLRPEER